MKIIIKLTNKAAVAAASFAEIELRISYFLKNQDGKFTPQTVTLTPAPSGELSYSFEENLAVERDVYFSILLRLTSVLAQMSLPAKALNQETPVIIEFYNDPVELTDPEADPLPPQKPLFAYGRLLEKNGRRKMDDVQIIFEAIRPGEDSPQPLVSVRTEANGYFFIDYPKGSFTGISARVGLNVVQNPVPVKLDVSFDSQTSVFPKNIIVVVELAETEISDDESDCGCGDKSLHDSKRVLEEYSFYSLVRTTEPEIKGFVIEEEEAISLSDILNDHPIHVWEIFEPLGRLPVFSNLRGVPHFSSANNLGGNVSRSGTSVPLPEVGAAEKDDEFTEALKNIKIDRNLLADFLKRESAVTKDNIVHLIDLNEALRFRRKIRFPRVQPLGRVVLNANKTVDWDLEPTIYQSVSVAHGHLLHFKSEWIADGYSLGDLLYSLPLAPGQKKQIVVFDWERKESAANTQSVEYEESLNNSLSRDRDIFEITKGTAKEKVSGNSSATSGSVSAGAGGVLGGILFGVSGGVGHSASNASQTSLRQTSASDLQKIRDRTVQSANAVRSQRTSVVQSVSQGERFEVSSETVANYNHCHAITIEYFEVLRHFKVRQRLANARECLFVPLLISQFNLGKLLRWKEALEGVLINAKLGKAFEAAERVKNEWTDSNFPSGTFASEKILNATGSFKIKFVIRRPDDQSVEVDDLTKPIYGGGQIIVGYQKKHEKVFDAANWQSLIPFLGSDSPAEFYENHLKNAFNRDEIFHRLLGEKIAAAFVDHLKFRVADETGNEISTVAFDVSLNSKYRREGTLSVSVRFAGPSQFSRDKVHYIKIQPEIVPDNSTINLESGFIRYRTAHYEGFLFRYQKINDDLPDGVKLFAGPGNDELRDPRKDDLAVVNKLIDHLNDNLEYYHSWIWKLMSPERRFMLLDGIILPGEKGGGRSLASLLENDLIGIVGNSLIFPVAQGLNLDPNFGLSDSLTDFYMVSGTEPLSISVPTKGVYAESMMGQCNSCEEKDESRFWRWEESPIPDSPTAINPINTDSRRADPGNLQPTPLAAPVLNIQNAPALPDPTGLAGTLSLLGKNDLFRDITGLSDNQKNAIEALKASYETTKTFGQEAAKLETQKMMDRRLDTALSKINSSGLPADKKLELTEKALNAYLGAGAEQKDAPATGQQKADDAKAKTSVIKDAVEDGIISSETGERLAASAIQHSLFGAAEEIAPGTIETQDLLNNPNLEGRDLTFENETFKFAAKSAAGGGGNSAAVGATPQIELDITWSGFNDGDLSADVQIKSGGVLLASSSGNGSATVTVDQKETYEIIIIPTAAAPDNLYFRTTKIVKHQIPQTGPDVQLLSIVIKLLVNRDNFQNVLKSWDNAGVDAALARDVVDTVLLGRSITVNRLVLPRVQRTQAAFDALPPADLLRITNSIFKIGSRVLRTQTGTSGLMSNHSLGCALDVNENMDTLQNNDFGVGSGTLLSLVQAIVRLQLEHESFDIGTAVGITQLEASELFNSVFPHWLFDTVNRLDPPPTGTPFPTEAPSPRDYSEARLTKAKQAAKTGGDSSTANLLGLVFTYRNALAAWIEGTDMGTTRIFGMIPLDRQFLEIMLTNGWAWGGDYPRSNIEDKDYMHFEDLEARAVIKPTP